MALAPRSPVLEQALGQEKSWETSWDEVRRAEISW
jgi:hypothetical protein